MAVLDHCLLHFPSVGAVWGLGWWHATEKILLLIFLIQIYKEDSKILQLKQKDQSSSSLGGGGEGTVLSNDDEDLVKRLRIP